ncbi:polyketide synthase [Sorangium cellulosum]|uniref:Polyketide synthase n=1 Tax=Sorangium cellulosum TaxID=56 RepID=A0A2L0EPE1_SORCE|nr:type I polyketide synthase [Sorangium cellulosum]AUX41122.1 polyketide synthase [Sorangium cellulosum]
MSDLVKRISALSPEKRALLARKMAASAEPPRRLGAEPVAVIGMACRFPGSDGADAFWRLLRGGGDAVSEVPSERWDAAAFHDPAPGAAGKMVSRRGGFLRDIDRFDAAFFGISPREAAQMDPQHRLMLEVAWEALENGGETAARLAGSRTGVFAAVYHRDYARLTLADAGSIDAYVTSGTHHSMAANRISYALDLRGPSMTVDTACSSSLVAVHLACRTLLARECDLAVVAAANLMLSPEESIAMSTWGMLSPAGRCRTFDAGADGFVRGEGCGALVLKRLAEALLDGDRVLAVVRGTAVNQDGRSNGITAPNLRAQVEVIRRALHDAGVAPAQIGYVEAHGTGTALGDPIEMEALREAVGQARPDGARCAVGAVKTNLGHLEAAAGMAGLMKAILVLDREEIPPNLHFERLNPAIVLDGTPFFVPAAVTPWPRGAAPRFCGTSAFGMGGTNAHVILEEAPVVEAPPPLGDVVAQLLPISARSAGALRELSRVYHERLSTDRPPPVGDLCAAAALRRTHHEHRLGIAAATPAEMAAHLDAFLRGEPRPGMSSGRTGAPPGVVFVFPGQGGQWAGMARGLLAREPVFREALACCDQALAAAEGWSLLAALAAPDLPARVGVVQPLLFAVQVALSALWRSWGVEPDAVVGHSMGEVAAAHVAGALDLDDAVRIIARRSRLLEQTSGRGAMLAVELSLEEADEIIASVRDRVAVAAHNGPTATVLSGEAAALDAIAARLSPRALLCRRIQVDVASHSPFMDALRDDLLEALAGLRARRAVVPLISTVTGDAVDGAGLDAAYWFRNLRQPVRFWPAVERLRAGGHRVFLELSPHPTLLPALEQGLRGASGEVALLSSMRRGEDERAVLLGSLGALYTRGAPVRWEKLYPAPTRPVALPPYPWQRERFWIEQRAPAPPPSRGRHPLLGRRVELAHAPGTHLWEGDVDPARLPFLRDHRVEGAVIMPGTACLEMALAAATEAFGQGPHALEDIAYEAAIFLPEGGARTLQVVLAPEGPRAASLRIHGRPSPEGAWVLHARARVRLGAARAEPEPVDLDAVRARGGEPTPGAAFYAARAALGNTWGPAFQGIARLTARPGEVLAEVTAPRVIAGDLAQYLFHPALLDACGQAMVAAGEAPGAFVLASLDRVVVHGRPGSRVFCHIVLCEEQEPGGLKGDVHILDERGLLVAELSGLRLRFLDHHAAPAGRERLDDAVHEVRWAPVAIAPQAGARRGLLVLAEEGGLGDRLAALAAERGIPCTLALAGERFAPLGPGRFRYDPARRQDVAALFAAAQDPPADTQVVHLIGLDTAASDLAAQRITASALHAAQALGSLGRGPCLWLVTRGAQAATSARVAVAQAPLWGFGRSLAGEHPARFGGLVDLDPDASRDADAAALLSVLAADLRPGVEIALRDGLALAPRLVPRPAAAPSVPLRLLPDRSYLITGGLGDLGLLVADRLVERGARHLVLLGRSPLPPRGAWRDLAAGTLDAERVRAVRALEAKGASVHLAAVDVGDEAALSAFLDGFAREERRPIGGVIHAAGVQSPGVLDQLDQAGIAADFRAKVAGSLHLDRLLREPLDFFVLFSSAAALVPSPFLAAYAAANAFLVALAHDRRARGLAALAVAWGFWAGGGMAERYRRREDRRAAPRGMESFTPAAGLDVLERLLASGAVEAAVIPANWPEFARLHPEAGASPLLAELVRGAGVADAPAAAALLRREALLAADRPERRRLVERYLRDRVARTLRLPAERLPLDKPLAALGLDSLMAVELKNRIEAELGLLLPVIRILECAGVEQLVDPVLDSAPPPEEDGWETLSL